MHDGTTHILHPSEEAGGFTGDPFGALQDAIRARLSGDDAEFALTFAAHFYGFVAPEDMAERDTADLCGALLSHLEFARNFAGGAPKLRVYNPRADEHGWHSRKTVVEIVNDDMPFLVDSLAMEINRQGLMVDWLIHPVMKMRRDADGRLLQVLDRGDSGSGRFESLMRIEVDRIAEAQQLQALHDGLLSVLADVRAAVDDWKAMKHRVVDILAEAECVTALAPEEVAEGCAFLRWVADDNFTLLGCRDYDHVVDAEQGDQLRAVAGSGLGVLRERGEGAKSFAFARMPPEMRSYALQPNLLTLTKANTRSTVHRPGYLDYIGVKRFNASGQVVGERRVLGLYTALAYRTMPTQIPVLRTKVAAVSRQAGFLPNSHAAKQILTILERYPRDELIQAPVDELYRHAIGILRLGERQRTRLFVRRDSFGRYYSSLLFVPRDVYTTALGERIRAMLMDAFSGDSSEFAVHLSDSPLARILIVVRCSQQAPAPASEAELEQRLQRLIRSWSEELRAELIASAGEERGLTLIARYESGFDAGYREDHTPQQARRDIELLDSIAGGESLAMNLYLPPQGSATDLRFTLYLRGEPAPLSRTLPMLEHMGVRVIDEQPFELRRSDGERFWISDFGMAAKLPADFDVDRVRERFHEAFRRTWLGDNDDDAFNRLVLLAGLDWRAVVMLRAYARYMKQAAFTFSQTYIENALAANPAITALLAELFGVRFDPAQTLADRAAAGDAVVAQIEAALEQVANLDEDRILRHYLALILATLRTNFYQRSADGESRPVLSFKLDPARVPLLPQPRPMFEIFVHSPRIEGVHLRGGKVARGGLRWSDRMEDFRTEVLGLVKAQQIKNAVIVPVGSKGGFVVRKPPAGDREAVLKEGIACYQDYLRGMLDLTDNLVDGKVVPPPDVVRHDDDDPYLVVAADKGTASFSDIANRTAAEYGFWLGDAFASGGSAGYDHKGMGITARGAWESAKHHFRSFGHDIQRRDFTVAGIGDMSGDVFGNGMLLSRHICLIAAFDHRHVFIDPSPDPAASHAERERLFGLPRSSWADYDPALISPGGGVFERSAKSITLSPEARAALGIVAERLTPNELVRAVLAAPVDLLYNGGIGTYVKASGESHAAVGDRANDSTRIDASALRCKVVVEGGNLGFTQRGRIEFALAGGIINTDAIDNSGGVDCSDHEVNIKILLGDALARGELAADARNALLAEMTDEVAELVLRDNRAQNRALALERSRGIANLDVQMRFMRYLVAAGRLDRVLENLPSDATIDERRAANVGLVTPELAVLLAYNKMALHDEVLASDLPDDALLAAVPDAYFPQPLRERHAASIASHPLRREIIATQVANDLVNSVGPSFTHRLHEESGASLADIVRAWLVARDIFSLPELWAASAALDGEVAVEVQHSLVHATENLLARSVLWLLQRPERLRALSDTIAAFAPGVLEVARGLPGWLSEQEGSVMADLAAGLRAQGLPEALASRVAGLLPLSSALDIVELARARERSVDCVASVYFGLGGRLDFGWLQQQIDALASEGQWAGLARIALREDLTALARDLADSVLAQSTSACEAPALIAAWEAKREFQLARCAQLLGELRVASAPDLAMLSVALRALRALV